jgi:hypothetical protein
LKEAVKMSEIIPIKPVHVLSHLKMLGVGLSKEYSSNRNTRKPGQGGSSPGWKLTSVDQTGDKALTVGGRVVTPAEAVLMHYNGGNWASTRPNPAMEQRKAADLSKILEHLNSQGFTVTPHGSGHLITRLG